MARKNNKLTKFKKVRTSEYGMSSYRERTFDPYWDGAARSRPNPPWERRYGYRD